MTKPLSKEGLETLALRCESAKGPDRELDRDIADAIGLGPDDSWERPRDEPATATSRGIVRLDKGSWIKGGRIRDSARYTASLDAAMTLVPDGMEFTLHHWRNASKEAPYLATAKVQLGSIMDPETKADFCRSPALALTAAALRAKSHLLKGNEHG